MATSSAADAVADAILAGPFRAAALFAGAFLVGVFFAGALRAAVFLMGVFFAGAFLTGFLAAVDSCSSPAGIVLAVVGIGDGGLSIGEQRDVCGRAKAGCCQAVTRE